MAACVAASEYGQPFAPRSRPVGRGVENPKRPPGEPDSVCGWDVAAGRGALGAVGLDLHATR